MSCRPLLLVNVKTKRKSIATPLASQRVPILGYRIVGYLSFLTICVVSEKARKPRSPAPFFPTIRECSLPLREQLRPRSTKCRTKFVIKARPERLWTPGDYGRVPRAQHLEHVVQIGFAHKVLGHSDRWGEVQGAVPPAVGHVEDLASVDDTVHAAGVATSGLFEEVHEPLDDTDRRDDCGAVGAGDHPRWRRTRRAQDPVLTRYCLTAHNSYNDLVARGAFV